MIICGVTSLTLEKDFFVILHPLAKIPFYGVMAVPISFAVVFFWVDVINIFMGAAKRNFTRKMVETH